jgi:radical SAM protein with 4Fe4S-binding SPASM domain
MDRPRLQTLILELAEACDHACLYCYNYWRHPASLGHDGILLCNDTLPPPGERVSAADLLAHVLDQADCGHVTLSGGEPLLCDDLLETVRSLGDRGVRVNLITNGHRLTEALTAELIRGGVSLFELPLLSHRREPHDALCNAPGAWDAVLAALAHIRAHRGQAVIAFVATRRNIADLGETIRLAFAFGARGVMLNRFNPGGRGAGHIEDLLPTLDELRTALQTAEAATVELGIPISVSITIQPCLIDLAAYPHLSSGFCGAGTSRAYYTLDMAGNVRPCNHSPTVLGNVWREPFAEIIAPQRMAHFAGAVPEFCQPCRLRDECQGGCKASAQVCYGDLCAEEPFLRANRHVAKAIRE